MEIAAHAERFTVEFEGARVAGYRWGDAPFVLGLHGWCGRGLQLSGLIAPLAERSHGLLVVDHPGHGESDGDQCTALMVAKILPQVVKRFPRTNLCVAHSFGVIGSCLAMTEGWSVTRAAFLGAITDVPLRFEEFAAAVGYNVDQTAEFLQFCEAQFGSGKIESISPTTLGPRLEAKGAIFHDTTDTEVNLEQAYQLARTWKQSKVIETSGLGHYRIIRDRRVLESVAIFLTETNDPAMALDDAAQ